MATCYITEWAGLGTRAVAGQNITMQAPGGFQTTNNVTITTATPSNAFGARTFMIEVSPDAVCSVVIGDNPTATTANMRIPADAVRYYAVSPGQKISVITNS